MTVEKNDVNISKLFMWGNKFEIKGLNEENVIPVYIRLVGDSELNRSRVMAIRGSADLRKKLKDLDSDERIAYIPEFEEIGRELAEQTILLLFTRIYGSQAIKEVNIPYPVEPKSDASLEQQEEYQAKVDDYATNREKAVREYIVKNLAAKEKELKTKEDSEIKQEYIRTIINDLCEQEMIKLFREYTIYFGTFSDENYKNRFFSSLEEFQNLPGEIKQQFTDYYQTLEISVDFLKISQGVTQ